MRKLMYVTAAWLLSAATAWAGESLADWRHDLGESDEVKAVEAAGKLAQSTDPQAVDVLLDTLAVGASPTVQSAALGALVAKKDPRELDTLKRFARNRNVELRKKALQAAAELNDPRAVALLSAALSDSNEEVRAAAATALGKRKERSAEPRLLKLLQHRDAAAAPAVAAIATPELAHRLSEMLGQVPDALLCSTFGEILKRPDFGPEPIRVEVVRTLSKVPGIDSTSALIEYIAATEKDRTRPSRVEAQKIVEQRSSQ
jgi:HEAT repeat protein